MKVCWQYLKAVLRHKWFTFLECRLLEIPLLGLVHDWTKFLPSEFLPYARWFYGKKSFVALSQPWQYEVGDTISMWTSDGSRYDFVVTSVEDDGVRVCPHEKRDAFDCAWNHHQKRNKHHWQYWVLMNDTDGTYPLPMPDRYRCEMLADWRGAGRAYGNPDTRAWYLAHRDGMLLHSETRAWLEWMLEIPPEDYWKGEVDE